MGARCDSAPMGLAVGTATATASGTETGTEVASGSVSGLISGLWVSVECKEDGGECAGCAFFPFAAFCRYLLPLQQKLYKLQTSLGS